MGVSAKCAKIDAAALDDNLRRFHEAGHRLLFVRHASSIPTPPGPPRIRGRKASSRDIALMGALTFAPGGWNDADLKRSLAEQGIAESRRARAKLSAIQDIAPIRACFVSEALRTQQTQNEMVPRISASVVVPQLHPVGFCRIVSEKKSLDALTLCELAFEDLGPAALNEYLSKDGLEVALMTYADCVLVELIPRIWQVLETSESACTIGIFGHAVMLNSVALRSLRGMSREALGVCSELKACELMEADGFLIGGAELFQHIRLGCETPAEKKKASTMARCRAFYVKNFLLLGLSLALFVGLLLPIAGSTLSSVKVRIAGSSWPVFATIAVICMFIINGLTLKSDDVKSALRAWNVMVYAIPTILLITPWISLVPISLGYMNPSALSTGFAIFNSVPTTLSSGVNLVSQSGGNAALALLLTVSTNLLGIFTVPFVLSVILGVGGINLSPLPLLGKLCITIIFPLLVGKAFRDFAKAVAAFVGRHKLELSLMQQFCVIFIAWMKLSDSASAITSSKPLDILLVLATSVAIHGSFLLVNCSVATWILRLPPSEWKVVAIVCSQKTFPVAVTVISFMDPEQVGDVGMLVVPCLMSHFTQLFWDAFLVTRWSSWKDQIPSKAAAPVIDTPQIGARRI